MNCCNSGNSRWLNQYEKEPFFKRTRYPFVTEGFCANRVGVHLLFACKPAREHWC